MPALDVPEDRILDTNGAGDIFHGAYLYSVLTRPEHTWDEHFTFARAASAYAIQHLGNEASLPTLAEINETHARFDVRMISCQGQQLSLELGPGIRGQRNADRARSDLAALHWDWTVNGTVAGWAPKSLLG